MTVSHQTEHYRRVVEFMELAGQHVPKEPGLPSSEVCMLRAKLILEEALETISALGIKVKCVDCYHGEIEGVEDVVLSHSGRPADLEMIVDGCADIMVVTTGTLIACGVEDLALLKLVDENNLAKFGPGGYRREDGKWVKPEGHKPPDIGKLIQDQRNADFDHGPH